MSVVITGAAQGIGLATSLLLRRNGAHVIGIDLVWGDAADELGGADLTRVEGNAIDPGLIDEACQTVGTLSGFVACAGISRPGRSDEYDMSDWRAILDVNLVTVFEGFRVAARYASDRASFVAISSISGIQGFVGRAAYAASKAGIDGMVRSLAVEYAPAIRVNSVAPGYIRTALLERNFAIGAVNETELLERTPMGRLSTADEVAAAIRFLLSADASWITGSTIVVDGGWTAFGLGSGEPTDDVAS